MHRFHLPMLLMSALILAGCIVGDQVTTFTINPDGSAELTIWRSNLHSTESGDAAVRELAEFQAAFAAQSGEEFDRIRTAGGTIVSNTLLRDQAPFASVIRARFDSAAVLARYFAAENAENGIRIRTDFTSDGNDRVITFQVIVPDQLRKEFAAKDQTLQQRRQAVADGISETRFAFVGGTITSADGFIIAGDRQSAVLAIDEVMRRINTSEQPAEFRIAWDVK
ncbi:MAG: hypothetical protein KDA85_12825 [Planctomycetaceae bacterium]|nr:hypothetical protein [Planctomycetaceae bacterium]